MYVLIMVHCNSSLCVILSSVNSQRAAPRGAAGEDSLHVVGGTGSKGTDGERVDSLQGWPASLTTTDSIFIAHLSQHYHPSTLGTVQFVQHSPDQST